MKVYDTVLKTNFYTDTQESHIGSQYQTSHDTPPITKTAEAIKLNALTAVEGLTIVYARDNGIYIRHTSMFVSGTKDWPQDHWDDVKIPCNPTAEPLRYRNADQALTTNEALYPEQQTTSLVGHSLGGSVVLEMQKTISRYNFQNYTIWSTSQIFYSPRCYIYNQRFKHFGDAISILDRGATSGLKASLTTNSITHDDPINASRVVYQALDNHSYDGFGNQQLDNTSRDMFVYKTDE